MALNNNILTLTGNLTGNPTTGVGRNGDPWTKLRVASTARFFDRGQNKWRDGDSLFLDVVCFRKLAAHAASTLERGDLVLITGRIRQRSYELEGIKHTVTEMEADAVGAELSRCPALLVRPPRTQSADEREPVADETALEVSAP